MKTGIKEFFGKLILHALDADKILILNSNKEVATKGVGSDYATAAAADLLEKQAFGNAATRDVGAGSNQVATGDHSHDVAYSAIDHDHNADYADINHNHDSDYATAAHGHGISNITNLQAELNNRALVNHSHPNGGFVKAWAAFSATGGTITELDSMNVASITRNGVGDYTVSWTTDFASADHAIFIHGQCSAASGGITLGVRIHTRAADSIRFITSKIYPDGGVGPGLSYATEDPPYICVLALGDQ